MLKEREFHPFTVCPVQELKEDNPDRQLQLYECQEHLTAIQENYLRRIFSMDGTTPLINYVVNKTSI